MASENQLSFGSLRRRESDLANNSDLRNKYSAIPAYRSRLYGRANQNSPSDNDSESDLSSNDESEGVYEEPSERHTNDSLHYKRVGMRLYAENGNNSLGEKDRSGGNKNMNTFYMDDSINLPIAPPPYHQISSKSAISGAASGTSSVIRSLGKTSSSLIYGSRLQNETPLVGGGNSSRFANLSPNTTTGPLVPLPNHVHPSQLLQPNDAPPSLRIGAGNGTSGGRSSNHHHSQSNANSAINALRMPFTFNWGKNCAQDRHPCLWKISTFLLTFILVILLFIQLIKSASNDSFNINESKPCIVVDESNSNGDKLLIDGSIDGQSSLDKNKLIPSSASNSQSMLPDQFNLNSREESNFYRKNLLNSCPTINIPQEGSLFSELKFHLRSSTILSTLKPFRSWTSQMTLNESTFIRFLFRSLPVWSRLALFARKNEPPTLTRYDLLEVISPSKPININPQSSSLSSKESTSFRFKRDSSNNKHELTVEILDYFEPATWYLMIVNDVDETIPLRLNLSIASDIQTTCPNDCHGHGKCSLGKCICFPGFIGHDCGDSVCPVLCNGQGRYSQGKCQCEVGWKGVECNIKSSECEVSNCNGHGRCVDGQCICMAGYKGDYCEASDCFDSNCGGHGVCIDGQCLCKLGWKGVNCSQIDERLHKYFPHCSGRGAYDLDTEKCTCFDGWSGSDCSIAKCNHNCGHGSCEGDKCICNPGWEGDRCDKIACDPRCTKHGQCANGTCVCAEGWMGKHCSFNGCPSSCSNHGVCAKDVDVDGFVVWRCMCKTGWTGKDCSHLIETSCSDDVDNDGDGLTDCADTECCSTDECKDSLMCLKSPDPLEILLRKPPPSVTASFYQKMKFLVEEGSVQSYAHRDDYSESQFWSAFDQSRVSVIRGQVITPDGNGLTGIRISVATDPQFGFTLTRPDGWFDILVNGGNMVTLQFQRSPFHPIKRTIMVPWNEIIVIQDAIMMSATVEDSSEHYHYPSTNIFTLSNEYRLQSTNFGNTSQHCWDHDYNTMKATLLHTLNPNSDDDGQKSCFESNGVIGESQVLLETLSIPRSSMKLVYRSSSSSGYLSTINLQLTSSTVPPSLRIVYLRIVVEGNYFNKLFDAEPQLEYTFTWNKRNVYRQKVYGLTNARVFVGYQYSTCSQIIWSTLTTQVRGFDMEISELASWNLNIHHRYNFQEKILQKGDGSAIFFKQQPRILKPLMGSGKKRTSSCKSRECDGLASSFKNDGPANQLLSPITLTNGPDASVYVGDGDIVRRIKPDGVVYTVFKLSDRSSSSSGRVIHHKSSSSSSTSSKTYNYHIHFSAYDGHLYIADPERHQILRVLTLDRVDDIEANFDVVVGSGARCLPRDASFCGDGGTASEASLVFPKGMAFGLDGSLYFADGSAIRMVNSKGTINTIIGDNHHASHHHRSGKKQWKPIPCDSSLPSDQVKLRWPTELAIHPVDGSLHFLDDQMIYRFTPDKRIMIIVGRPSYCENVNSKYSIHHGHQHWSKNNPLENKTKNKDEDKHGHLRNHKRSSSSSSSASSSSFSHNQSDKQNIGSILSFAFNSDGQLFAASIGKDGVNTISLVRNDGYFIHFMGLASHSKLSDGKSIKDHSLCEIETCKDASSLNCTCALQRSSSFSIKNPKIKLARETSLVSVTSITITNDGVVHVADEAAYRILSAILYLPTPDDQLQFTIPNLATDELYVFNKYGQHLNTKNATTDQTLNTFFYDLNTSIGKLSAVSDASGNEVSFLRDSVSALYSIETANVQRLEPVQKCRITVNNQGLLETFTDPDKLSTRFTYDSLTGLLLSRSDSTKSSYRYQYSPSGRLIGVVDPSGKRTAITFDMNCHFL